MIPGEANGVPLGEKIVESCILLLGVLGPESNGCMEPKASAKVAELLSWGTAGFLSFASNFLIFKILSISVCVCMFNETGEEQ